MIEETYLIFVGTGVLLSFTILCVVEFEQRLFTALFATFNIGGSPSSALLTTFNPAASPSLAWFTTFDTVVNNAEDGIATVSNVVNQAKDGLAAGLNVVSRAEDGLPPVINVANRAVNSLCSNSTPHNTVKLNNTPVPKKIKYVSSIMQVNNTLLLNRTKHHINVVKYTALRITLISPQKQF